ncbi:autotransporter domain-containing protein [Sphingomonas sp. CGMCC 1.13654]|uniref:Autotransporter domain-containing protein n=1 Tax=Sphingomonas chungangi TaxID=2683589 RepID=A0A838LGB4_9SPHN|nr:autotransporter outer membrane beta-barrel domain-containing protein [Sphingomonas chungangi]MBA2936468.1 autotransporter domain-containing protein [Sphingomonas chungangi]MVW55853.1 autotransporter domain-containing protein [Sphingomonas chungangi]
MRRLFATTCLTPIALGLFVSPAIAATVTIGAAQTTPVKTSTADSGGPADISITSAGSITPTSGTAVTIDSNNSVTNAGGITITGSNGAIGILANAGTAGTITNSGTITVNEDYTRTDTNGDGVLDGAWAQGSDRYGIRTAGAFTGNVVNSGTITIEGNDSAGISLDGPLTGSLTQSGTISVTGDDSVGVRANAISGDAAINGTISATGGNASGVQMNGDIGGALVVQATITSTGYSATTPPTDTSKLTDQNLLQGGPAMAITGSIAGGALFTTASSTTDSSGNTVTTAASSLTTYGSSPALLIGAADHAITLGSVASDTNKNGLVINGSLTGNGVYDGKTASGLVIGGQGGAVTITNGMTLAGSVTATSNDASATAIRIGSGASVPAITSSGTITASGAYKAGDSSTALQIDAGGNVSSIANSGTITATASSPAANAYAILDKSGTVTAVTNTGTIKASGSTATNVAIDLSAATANTAVTQSAAASGSTAPSITGDIRFGSGSDTLTVSAGSVAGNVSFGGGTNTMALSGTSTYAGTTDFGGGAGNLTIADTSSFSGSLTNAGGVAVKVSGGTLGLSSTGATALGSLQVTGGGTLGVVVDGTTGASTLYQVAGAASFDSGSKLALHFSDINHTIGTYQVITAGSLTGVDNLSTTGVALPWLYKSSVTTNTAGNAVDVVVARKTAADLGLNRSESSAYDAIYTAISGDKPIGDSFLSIADGNSFIHALRSLLPDHAGGSFDTVTSGSRATARFLADPDAPLVDEGNWGFWLQQVGWGRTKAIDDTAGYKITGWGASGGGEIKTGFGRFGIGLAYLSGTNDDEGTQNSVTSNQYEASLYWRGDWGGLHTWARASGATINFHSHRRFEGEDDGSQVIRTADGRWNGKLFSGSGGLSYSLKLGKFSLRPQASVDYYHLHEGGYSEDGGGTGMDLIVDGRTSDEFAANGSVALGYQFFDERADEGGFFRAELEGGRRQLISSKLGDTVARFTGGQDFTLTADDRTSGWTGAFRLKGGTSGYTISGEFDGEQQQDHVSIALRAGLQVGF